MTCLNDFLNLESIPACFPLDRFLLLRSILYFSPCRTYYYSLCDRYEDGTGRGEYPCTFRKNDYIVCSCSTSCLVDISSKTIACCLLYSIGYWDVRFSRYSFVLGQHLQILIITNFRRIDRVASRRSSMRQTHKIITIIPGAQPGSRPICTDNMCTTR